LERGQIRELIEVNKMFTLGWFQKNSFSVRPRMFAPGMTNNNLIMGILECVRQVMHKNKFFEHVLKYLHQVGQ